MFHRIALATAFAIGTFAFGQTESVIYTFQGQTANDGQFPEFSALILDNSGNLYGTTTYGGGGPCSGSFTGCGMIYRLSPNPTGPWQETAIWRFQGGIDGGFPGGLLVSGGKLWGVAGTGGTGSCSSGCGYLFSLTPLSSATGNWTKTDVYDFPDVTSECSITAVDPAGNFYGAGNASINPNGSICKLTRPGAGGPTWRTTHLYTFKGVAPGHTFGDGSGPMGVAFDAHGNLWGATNYGEYCQNFEGGSCFGTFFTLTRNSGGGWTESVVYRFRNLDQNPTSNVTVDSAGAVYGVTYVETYKFFNGAFTVIDNFADTIGNAHAPTGGVVLDAAGNVYGTTGAGGQFDDGTVYKLTAPSYTQTILHSFSAGTDGWNPEGLLTLGPGGVLFGTTQVGGNQICSLGGGTGCGTVFRVVQ